MVSYFCYDFRLIKKSKSSLLDFGEIRNMYRIFVRNCRKSVA